MVIQLFLIIIGFAALIFGANWLVDGASALAKKYRVSDLVIGLTIVALGTSAPELVVNVFAAMDGYSEIILGNILGSNNMNLFIILGITGLILPFKVQSSTAWREIPISLIITLLAFLLLKDFDIHGIGDLTQLDGVIMLVVFLLFMGYVFKQSQQDPGSLGSFESKSMVKILILVSLGLGGLFVGGQLVVENAILVASDLGVSEKIIGLTVVAIGTSLPELVTCVIAAVKGNSDIAIGNVIGSNIFNLLIILAITSIVNPIAYASHFDIDFYILLGGTAFLFLAMLTGKRKTLDRWEAGLMLLFYLFYAGFLISGEL